MSSQREKLEESKDFWQESANHDMRQSFLSLGVAASGSATAAIGLLATFEGQPIIGVPVIVVGAGMLMAGIRDAKKEDPFLDNSTFLNSLISKNKKNQRSP